MTQQSMILRGDYVIKVFLSEQ